MQLAARYRKMGLKHRHLAQISIAIGVASCGPAEPLEGVSAGQLLCTPDTVVFETVVDADLEKTIVCSPKLDSFELERGPDSSFILLWPEGNDESIHGTRLKVRYAPQDVGSHNAVVKVSGGDLEKLIRLKGKATEPPRVSYPSLVYFKGYCPDCEMGEYPETGQGKIEIQNLGAGELILSNPRFDGEDIRPVDTYPIVVGSMEKIELRFEYSTSLGGSQRLTLDTNDPYDQKIDIEVRMRW